MIAACITVALVLIASGALVLILAGRQVIELDRRLAEALARNDKPARQFVDAVVEQIERMS